MKIIFKLGYTKEDQLPRKSQYRTKQMIQLLEYLKAFQENIWIKDATENYLVGSSKEFYFQYPFVWYALIVGTLAIGYLLMNIFSTGPNLSGDVCSTLFGSTSILTLTHEEVLLCAVLSIMVVILFILLYLALSYQFLQKLLWARQS